MKRIISLVLLLSIMVIIVSSCARFNDTDKNKAETLAKQQAGNYYSQYFRGKTLSGVTYYSCDFRIDKSDFKNGKYVVKIDLYPSVSSGGYSLSPYLMSIEYSIVIKNGIPEVVDTNYINR